MLQKFLSGFRRKHLFITTFIEKHCTWPLFTYFNARLTADSSISVVFNQVRLDAVPLRRKSIKSDAYRM